MDKLIKEDSINNILNRDDIKINIKEYLADFELNKNNNIKRGIYVYGLPGCGKTYFVTKILKEQIKNSSTLPKYCFLVKSVIRHADDFIGLPSQVYIFPPLLMNASFEPKGNLIPKTKKNGEIF